MARNPDIRYINSYAEGSAARVLEPTPRKKKAVLPRAPKRKVRVVALDITAVGGIVMAVLLAVTLLYGLVQLQHVQQQTEDMERYVHALRNQNAELRFEYENSYDLEEVRKLAESMGYVPADALQSQDLVIPEVQEAPSVPLWQKVADFFRDLFA